MDTHMQNSVVSGPLLDWEGADLSFCFSAAYLKCKYVQNSLATDTHIVFLHHYLSYSTFAIGTCSGKIHVKSSDSERFLCVSQVEV